MSYRFLLDIALILVSTKILGLITKRFQMPQVVGALVAGLILGPAAFNILQETEFLTQLSELGVIVIMFTAGMGTDIRELKNSGKSGFWVALCGVLVPLLMGTGLAFIFNRGELAHPGNTLLQNIFIGVILTATSVSITVETLKEMGKLNTQVGNTILAAALIDDVLGLIALTIITSLAGAEVSILIVLAKIVGFFVFAIVFGWLSYRFFNWYENKIKQDLHRFPVLAFVLCLLMAYIAERFFGVADIIGAFGAGLVIANTSKAKYIESKFGSLSYLLLTPIFFASVGIKVELPKMDATIILFTICLIIVSVLSKLIGCGLGAKLCGYSGRKCVQIGVGMICRGEVALIVANKGIAMNLMPEAFLGPVILTVVLVTILTPILLRLVFKSKSVDYTELRESALVEGYEEVAQLDYMEENLLEAHHQLKQKK